MRSSLRVVAAMAALLATLVLVPAAGAAVKAQAKLLRTGDSLRLEVTVTSTKAFTATTKPRGVKVGTLSLKRTAASRKSMTFRSSAQRGAAATKLEALANKPTAIRVTTRSGARTMRARVLPAPNPGATTPGATTPGTPGTTTPTTPGTTTPGTPAAQATLTRNDAAGQAAMAGNLMLEWASFGSVTAEYRRVWLMSDGAFRVNVIDWMQQTGEKCRESYVGTWTFKEGYTTDANGGGVVVKIAITYTGGGGDEVLAFANNDPNAVYVGPQGQRYERNPQINQNCP